MQINFNKFSMKKDNELISFKDRMFLNNGMKKI